MNCRPDQLAAQLTKKTFPVYAVFGDEPLQQMEVCDQIRQSLRQQGFSEREVLDVDAQFDWQQFVDATASLSLFSEQRIIELRIPSGKPGRQGAEAIKNYCQRPLHDIALLINAGKLDKNSRSTAWFKALSSQALVVQCWPVKLEALPGWIGQRFLKVGMQADQEVQTYISTLVEGNLLAAAQEIDKLSLLLGPGPVSLDDVVNAVTSQTRFNLFEMLDTILQGDQARVVRMLDGLKDEGMAPIMINNMLARDVRLLCELVENRAPLESTLKRAGVWSSRTGMFRACLSRHSPRFFYAMLKRCALIDRASKGVADTDPWDELLGLGFRLAGSSR